MWFNSALVYHYELDEAVDLNAALEELFLKPCPPHARFIYGWLPTIAEQMVHIVTGSGLICMGKEERILPRAVIVRTLEEKIQVIEQQQNRKVKRSERAHMAEDIEFELLPKAFCIQKKLNALLDSAESKLIINTSSVNQAEQVLTLLRKTIPTIRIEPLSIDENLAMRFAEWINSPVTLPACFQLASDCLLFSLDDENKRIQCKGYELPAEEVLTLLSQGMATAEISLIWRERIQFTLTQNFTLKKIKSLDTLVNDFEQVGKIDEEFQKQDAALALLGGEMRMLLQDLLKALPVAAYDSNKALSI